MTRMVWDDDKIHDALRRESRRIGDSTFLSETERDTFEALLFMMAWLMIERRSGELPAFSDESMQPLRDWMMEAGRIRRQSVRYGFQLPHFASRTDAERTGLVVEFPSGCRREPNA